MAGDSSLIPKVEKDAELTFLDGINERMDAIKSRLLEMKDIFTSGFWEGLGDYKPILNEISKDFQSINGWCNGKRWIDDCYELDWRI